LHSATARNLAPIRPGERTNPQGKAVANKILLSISNSEYDSVRPYLEHVALVRHKVLHEPNEKLQFVYFPNAGLLSLVVLTADGKSVEAGKEGIAGMASAVGLMRSPLREIVQIAGDGFRIPVASLQEVLRFAPQLQMMLRRHAVLHGLRVSQTAACNRLRNVEQRLARWLLIVRIRSASDSMVITHDFLAGMLGTDRPSVSLAAANFQRRQIIEYTRGALRILNCRKLEKSACQCYAVIRQLDEDPGIKQTNERRRLRG